MLRGGYSRPASMRTTTIQTRRVRRWTGLPSHPRRRRDRCSIAGDVAMGKAWNAALATGACASIPTGGVVPDGADAVVPIEDVRIDGNRIVVETAIAPGENVSPRAGDMRRGERILEPGQWLAGPQIGVLATVGAVEVPVYRRPVIAMISSGDELVPPSSRPRPGEVRDSNRYAIAASLRMMGASVRHYPTVSDDRRSPRSGAEGGSARLRCDRAHGRLLGRRAGSHAGGGGFARGARGHRPRSSGEAGEANRPGGRRRKAGHRAARQPDLGADDLGGDRRAGRLRRLPEQSSRALPWLLGWAARLGAGPSWTWYVPVALQNDGGTPVAHPLPLRSSSVSLPARAGGYIVVEGHGAELPAGTLVTVFRFLGR